MRAAEWPAVIIAGCLVIGSASAGAYGPEPLSESEVYSFLYERDTAFRTCDVEWVTQHHVPGARFSFEAVGKRPVVEQLDQVLRNFRETCRPSYVRASFDQRSWSVRVGGSQATVRTREARGPFGFFDATLQRLHISPKEVDSVECTITLIRGMDGKVKLQSERWLVGLRQDPGPR